MILGESPVYQAFLATMFTWFVTAAGSGMVFFFKGFKQSLMNASLGFAGGVMTAASFWSLLLPAIEIAQFNYDGNKQWSCLPIAFGFICGAFFVYATDLLLPENYLDKFIHTKKEEGKNEVIMDPLRLETQPASENEKATYLRSQSLRSRTGTSGAVTPNYNEIRMETDEYDSADNSKMRLGQAMQKEKFRRILLLIIAVTVHNIPEGLAVGVGFGAVGKTTSATFVSARNLAFGIGLQNFPEGLAVSLPLYTSGFSMWKSFWYGQLSGMVEPIAGIIGAYTVNMSQSILPYALTFAAGAMIYVVVDNLIPEATSNPTSSSNKLSSWSFIFGFCLMMCLDVGLG